jgi:hypothetical protein
MSKIQKNGSSKAAAALAAARSEQSSGQEALRKAKASAAKPAGASKNAKNKQQLRNIYNQNVVSAESMMRPDDWYTGYDKFFHMGVKIRSASGKEYLVHHDSRSKPVLTPAENCSKDWKLVRPIDINGEKHIGDVMQAAGDRPYTWYGDNCVSCVLNVQGALKAPKR